MNQWILLDIGNVILIDEPLMALNWTEIYRATVASGKQLTFQELMVKREEAVLEQRIGAPHEFVGIELLGEEEYRNVNSRAKEIYLADYLKFCFVHRDAREVLSNLSENYRLAIAANQPKDVFRQAMTHAGLLQFFEMHGISEEMGVSKPSKAFFEYIVAEIGGVPTDTIMVGDRIDNDIAPAQALGMKTIWVKMTPEAQGYRPTDELEKLYVESLRNAQSRGVGKGNESIEPDVTVTEVQGIAGAINQIG
jgi:HAD superfamily hydrolase (TIGR01549 family)